MLVNLSGLNPEVKDKIDAEVGKPFDLEKRKELGGIDSGKLIINSCSIDIYNLIILDPGIKTCNVEIRPDGIIVRFQVGLDSYALVIPYYKLKVYKGKAREYSIYKDQYFIKVEADRQEVHDFMKKIRNCKAEHWTSSNFYD